MAQFRKKFIALDLETTHLDVREGRIMEVGAVEGELFFDGEVKVRFGKSFTTLVNPEIEPSDTALTLTGIAKDELATAPLWRDVKADFQKFLAEAVLVGQNLNFDLAFLKNQGLDLKNSYFDTLEMAQVMLPLADSHSLEYMAESLGVLSGSSHRALPDSQNTARVLAGLLNEFLKYPKDLQSEIKKLLGGSAIGFRELFLEMPEVSGNYPSRPSATLPSPGEGGNFDKFDLPDKTIISLPLSYAGEEKLLQDLAGRNVNILMAVAHPIFLEGLPVEQKISHPDFTLCTKRLSFLESQPLADAARQVLIKIKILQELRGTLDLSSLRFLPEEREILAALTCEPGICPKHGCAYAQFLANLRQKTLFCTLEALFQLVFSWNVDFAPRKLVMFELAAVEDEFTEGQRQTWNLQKARLGLPRTWAEAERMGNELDLFFGILHLVYLKRTGEFAQNLMINSEESNSERFAKLLGPAEKLVMKLEKFAAHLEARAVMAEEALELLNLREKILNLKNFLREFFWERAGDVIYWLKFNDTWVDLNCMPASVRALWEKFLPRFASTTILDRGLPRQSFGYYQKRLGLANFQVQKIDAPRKAAPIAVAIYAKALPKSEYVDLLKNLTGRALVVLPNETALGDYFQELKKAAPQHEILAYKYSGNAASLKAKTQREDFLLLLTHFALRRHFPKLPALQNLVIFRIPFEPPLARPELAAVSAEESFSEIALPRAVYFFHAVLQKFAAAAVSPAKIFIFDHRILTEYNRAFMSYLEEFPEFYPVRTITDPREARGIPNVLTG